ncbi:DNA polymerase III subunit epsilon [Neoroseomonas oryzicola]|uniref:DNA polymerase III subunit epsilon n=1 Tax=Neoroseomonas oryzicola TaxID=535904 RepID=A0A9X9WFT4_9PROT|nr:DNA polymerase III subunit epsilon [Neoroseomonas oryzicola]MBR0659194.1 DNA polymerase III subunit epsilon [Neoroseomonas oryzicola]NKE17767.1 DNA polymerase III subunit epsilon [Neoroseomonas oryzicola]
MRQIVLDTETTGLDPALGDRVIEVAAVELVNLLPTGATFHRLVDPERDIPAEATRVHGFTNGDLAGKPKFAEIAAEMLDFLGDAPIIAHNAPFDFGFLDAELKRCGKPALDRARMVDSLVIAKQRYPGMPNSLDALCRRLGVDNSMRAAHNAILDCTLLAQVYLELMGGKQPGFELAASLAVSRAALAAGEAVAWTATPIAVPEDRAAAHAAFVKAKVKDALWLKPPFADGGETA